MKNYYVAQLARLTKQDINSEYRPTFVIKSGVSESKTNHLSLNKQSAKVLVKWLQKNVIDNDKIK